MITKKQSVLGGVVLALVAGLGIWFSCESCAAPQAEDRAVALGVVEIAGDKKGPAAELVGGLPASFLVGSGNDVEIILKERTRLHAAWPKAKVGIVVDGAGLDALKLTALSDRLVEASLDDGGPILLDRAGDTARSLRDGAVGIFLVRLNTESRVAKSVSLPGATVDAERAAIGEVP